MCCTWCSAVRREITSRSAISGLEHPAATSRATSTSRSESPPAASCPAAGAARAGNLEDRRGGISVEATATHLAL